MIRALLALIVLPFTCAIPAVLIPSRASAESQSLCPSTSAHSDATDISLNITDSGVEGNASRKLGKSTQPSGCGDQGTYRYEPMCGKGSTGGACGVVAQCGNDGMLNHVYYTPPGGTEEDQGFKCIEDGVATPAITQRIVLRALKRIVLPKPKMIVQPPGGKTLVKFDTLFHTEADTINRSIRLLGKRVNLQITPASYLWHHGDDTTQTTSTPGIEYESDLPMDSYISHQYTDADVTVHPSVDVSYTARYRVNGGAWMSVAGTVTRPGPPVDLRIVEGRTVLLGR